MNKLQREMSVSVRMVKIKGREIAIELSPVPTIVQGSDRFVALSPRPGLMVLRPDWTKRLGGGMGAVGGVLLLVTGLLCLMESIFGLVLAVPGAVSTTLGLWILGPVYRFRLDAGEWSTRHFGRTRKRPLASILAVQVTEEGWISFNRPGGRYFLYQLNLVLDEPAEQRLCVYSYRHLDDILRIGRLLAEFLEVPLTMSDGIAAKSG